CFQAEDGIRDWSVTGVQTCALPISRARRDEARRVADRWLRRSGQGPARRPGRRRRGRARPKARAARTRRFQEARPRDARKAARKIGRASCRGRGGNAGGGGATKEEE